MESTTESLPELASRGSFETLEERWLEALSDASTPGESFLETANILAEVGEKDRACVLLLMLHEDRWNAGRAAEALDALRAAGEIRPNERTLRPKVLEAVRAAYKDEPTLELYIEKSELAGTRKVPDALRVLEELLQFKEGRHVYHGTGWGTGKIVEFDPTNAELTVDFEEDKGHVIPVDSARDIFEILDDEDLRVYRFSRREDLDALAKDKPAEVIKLALKARGGRALVAELRNDLRESVIPQKTWSRWWTKARREAAKDPFIEIEEGTKPAYCLRDEPKSLADEALESLRDVEALRDAVQTARAFTRKGKESLDVGALCDEVRRRTLEVWEGLRTEEPGQVLEALLFLEDGPSPPSAGDTDLPKPSVFVKEELDRAAAGPAQAGAGTPNPSTPEAGTPEAGGANGSAVSDATVADDPADAEAEVGAEPASDRPVDARLDALERASLRLLDGLTIQEYRNRFLALARKARPDDWPALYGRLVTGGAPDLFDLGLTTLRKADELELVERLVDQVVQDPLAYAEPMVLFARGFFAGRHSVVGEDVTELLVLRRVIQLYEKIQRRRPPLEAAELKKFLTRIENLLLDSKSKHLERILKETSLAEMTRIFQESEASPYLSTDLKRAIQTTVARTHPVLLRGEGKPFWQEDYLYCSEKSIAEKREEFKILTEVKIPENSKAVGAAASLGDLSENSEYTSALESQRLLTEKAEELRADLDRARAIENQHLPDGKAVPGTRVRIREEASGEVAEYALLGPWDAREEGVISYLSPIGQSLLGHRAGERVEAELPAGTKAFVIESIEKIER